MRDLSTLAEQIRAVRQAQRRFIGRWRLEQVIIGPDLLDHLADQMAAAHAELDTPDSDDAAIAHDFDELRRVEQSIDLIDQLAAEQPKTCYGVIDVRQRGISCAHKVSARLGEARGWAKCVPLLSQQLAHSRGRDIATLRGEIKRYGDDVVPQAMAADNAAVGKETMSAVDVQLRCDRPCPIVVEMENLEAAKEFEEKIVVEFGACLFQRTAHVLNKGPHVCIEAARLVYLLEERCARGGEANKLQHFLVHAVDLCGCPLYGDGEHSAATPKAGRQDSFGDLGHHCLERGLTRGEADGALHLYVQDDFVAARGFSMNDYVVEGMPHGCPLERDPFCHRARQSQRLAFADKA